MTIHICPADPARGHLEQLQQAAISGKAEFDWWNITRKAQPGDVVVFYLMAPTSAFVATGTVARVAVDSEVTQQDRTHWDSGNCFWISNAKMLPRAVPLAEAKQHLPEWAYLTHPKVTSIPNASTSPDVVEKFLRLLQRTEASDLAEPPPRVATTISRIVRDTALACAVKSKHDYRCQICGQGIELPGGGRYAEAHHIRPLGGEHQGPDVLENILCLCPNHHAELDLFARPLLLAALRIVDGHTVSPEFIEYHNREHHKKYLAESEA